MSDSGDVPGLREIFDRSAERYQQARPDYPMAIYDELIELTGITTDSHLLEIGCATGKATLPWRDSVSGSALSS